MQTLKITGFFILQTILFASCQTEKKADLVLINGYIQTVDETLHVVEAMAVTDGKISDTGTTDEILARYDARDTINLEGKFVYPGFIDPHSHFFGYSRNLLAANLWRSESMQEITERLVAHQNTMVGSWVQGRGWDQNLFDVKQMPDNRLLNQVFPEVPVYITRVDGHAAVANQKALELADVDAQTRVEGGEVVVKNGKPTGLLIDKAMQLVSSVIPKPTTEEMVNLLKRAQNDMFEVGLTSVCDAGLSKSEILLLDSLQQKDQLSIRVYAMLNPSEENFAHFLPAGPYITEKLTVRAVKLFADGALGSRGALLKKPYTDDPENNGLMVDSKELIQRSCKLAFENGFQVNTHCIGDSAVSLMLNTYAGFLAPENDLRWRIEHAQVVSPEDIDMFGRYNIIPSIQAIHAVSDMQWAENRIGADRIKGAYAYRDLMEQTGWLPNGSDFPVEQINPLYSYHAAFTRTDRWGNPEGGWYPQQLLTREEALRAMTIWAAKANFEEQTRGSLEKGKFADFVILNENLLSVKEKEIYQIKVEETWLNGEQVFMRQ